MTTLALDLGTACGFAILREDGRVESGTETFERRKNEGEGMRFVRFRHWLVSLKAAHELKRVTYEIVMGHGPAGTAAGHLYGGFLATLMSFCEHHQIPYAGHHVGTIKKRWTGNGNAKKPDMIARCHELGFHPGDDNEADAIALLHVELDLAPAIPAKPPASIATKPRTKQRLKAAA